MLTSFRRRLLVRLAMLADLGIFIAALLTAFWVNSLDSAAGKFVLSKVLNLQIQVLHVILLVAVMTAWHVLFRLHRLYESRRLDKDSQKIWDVVRAATWGTAVSVGVAAGFKINVVTPAFIVAFWVSSTAYSLLFRLLLTVFLVRMRLLGRNLRYVVIIGTNQKAYNIARALTENKSMGYRVVGHVDNTIHLKNHGINHLGTLQDLPSIVKTTVIDEIIITLPVRSHYEEIQRIILLAEEQGIRTRCLADVFETKQAPLYDDGAGLSSTVSVTGVQKEWHQMVKRAVDIVLASVMLVLAMPVMMAAAVAIKVTSPGPVLFIQTRVGLNKRRFELYKFRTMVVNAENLQAQVEHLNEMDGPVFKIANDPRVTPLGRLLRKTSIDELPQLVNVLKGDMSLVGPRPLPERDYSGFDQDWQRKRFSVPPGITCIWQVSGRNNVAFDEWMKMDMEYIDRWTPLYDFKILMKTIPAVIKRKGAA